MGGFRSPGRGVTRAVFDAGDDLPAGRRKTSAWWCEKPAMNRNTKIRAARCLAPGFALSFQLKDRAYREIEREEHTVAPTIPLHRTLANRNALYENRRDAPRYH